ncbi:MAG: 4Fe-4S dicluster domain-containing protein [Bacillota bacterium]
MARFIPEAELESVLSRLAGPYRLYLPLLKGDQVEFGPWSEGERPVLEGNAYGAAKQLFFPRSEILFSFSTGPDGRPGIDEVGRDPRPLAVFGIRPCDARSVKLLDNVFLRQDPPDSIYLSHRQGSLLIGLACDHPGRSCFCGSLGGSPAGTEGLDLLLTAVDGGFTVDPVSEAGREYASGEGWPEASAAQVAQARAAHGAAAAQAAGVDTSGLAEKLERMFDHEFWARLHEKCLGCAACTFFCPTCHCFDVVDEGKPGSGIRLRNWDSCMFPLFTLHTSGHNPRMSGKERMRQRVMHKFCYYPLRFGPPACVGCGRCIEVCPVNLDIRLVLAELGGLA